MAFVVSDEPGKVISVLLDLTYLDPYAFLVASVPKGGRALPIGWHVFRRDLAGEGAVSQNQLIGRLLGQVLGRIPRGITPIVVADREFARAIFFRFLQAQQRDFVVRVDCETWVIHPTYTGAIGTLACRPGMRKRWLPGALYGRDEQVPINLLVVWQRGYRELWLLATTLVDPQQALALYRSRMKIEHGFRYGKPTCASRAPCVPRTPPMAAASCSFGPCSTGSSVSVACTGTVPASVLASPVGVP